MVSMNRSAYLSTGLAVRALSRLSKADIAIHGQENIPKGPTIFVVNHFTRLETLLLPSYILTLTERPVRSLAAADLFKGGVGRFLEMVGAISTKDPQRDQFIIRTLLTGEADWIIFPEGVMVKTKKILHRGRYMIADPQGLRTPHTGAANLALRTELYRSYLLGRSRQSTEHYLGMLDYLDIDSLASVREEGISIVPVNLTYYPIRARENIASTLASRLVDDLPERVVEEIMTEGTMLFSGVDLDIRFGRPITVDSYLNSPDFRREMQAQEKGGFFMTAPLDSLMRRAAHTLMQQYMHDIYAMTTINHEHLFALFLRLYPFKRIREKDLRRRVFYAAMLLGDKAAGGCFLHKSLASDQSHLVADDRFKKFDNFLRLALETGILRREGDFLVQDRSRFSVPLSIHRSRIENPIEIIANEAEPLTGLRRLLSSLAWRPDLLLRLNLAWYLLKKEIQRFREDSVAHAPDRKAVDELAGRPIFLPGLPGRGGVVLVHSYLAVPAEVRQLASSLQRRGLWVYAPRLPGHGTSPEDLARRTLTEWLEAVERAYALLSVLCPRVALGGISVGASLALDLASSVKDVAAVFAVCPPFRLHDFSARFMPAVDVWERLLQRMKGEGHDKFLPFSSDNPQINYSRNPVSGIREVGRLLAGLEDKLPEISQPALIIQADGDPVIDAQGSQRLYSLLGSRQKEYSLIHAKRHILVQGEEAKKIHRQIFLFLRETI
jgi:esterase/lipase/1-acyl-sn-glycerol-3-phosphate acyltransferase